MHQAVGLHLLTTSLALGQIPSPSETFVPRPQPGVARHPALPAGEEILAALGELTQTPSGPVYRVTRGDGPAAVTAFFRFNPVTPPNQWQICVEGPTTAGTFPAARWLNCGPTGHFAQNTPNHQWLNALSDAMSQNPPGTADLRAVGLLHRDGHQLLSSRFEREPEATRLTGTYVMQTGQPGVQLWLRWTPTNGNPAGQWQYRVAASNDENPPTEASWQPLTTAPQMTMPAGMRTTLGWGGPAHDARAAQAWGALTSNFEWARDRIAELSNPMTRSQGLDAADTLRMSAAYLRLNGHELPSNYIYRRFAVSGTPQNFQVRFDRAAGVYQFSTDGGDAWTTISATSAAPYAGTLTPEQRRANTIIQGLGQGTFNGIQRDTLKVYAWSDQMLLAGGAQFRADVNDVRAPANYNLPLPNGRYFQVRPTISGDRLTWQFRTDTRDGPIPTQPQGMVLMQSGSPGVNLWVRWASPSSGPPRWEYRLAPTNETGFPPNSAWQPLTAAPPADMPAPMRAALSWTGATHDARAAQVWQAALGRLTWARTGLPANGSEPMWLPIEHLPTTSLAMQNLNQPTVSQWGLIATALGRICPNSNSRPSMTTIQNTVLATMGEVLAGNQMYSPYEQGSQIPMPQGHAMFQQLADANFPNLRVQRIAANPGQNVPVLTWRVTSSQPTPASSQIVEYRQISVEHLPGQWRPVWQWSIVADATTADRHWRTIGSQGSDPAVPIWFATTPDRNIHLAAHNFLGQRLFALSPHPP